MNDIAGDRDPDGPLPRGLLWTVALVTGGVLVAEVLQTITLSLQIFSQNAFLVVSIAMLGLGVGGSVATRWTLGGPPRQASRLLWVGAVGFALSLVATSLITARTWHLGLLIMLTIVPYGFAGFFLSILFAAWPQHIGRTYFADLMGSAIGCIAVVTLVTATGSASMVLLLVAAVVLLGGALLGTSLGRGPATFSGVAALGVLALIPVSDALFPFHPHPVKLYGRMLVDDSIHEVLHWSRWGFLGRLDIVEPGEGQEELPGGPSLAKLAEEGGSYRYLFASADHWSYIVRFADDAQRETWLQNNLHRSPHVVTGPGARVMTIGVGGGVDLLMGVSQGAASIDAVEINPLMVEAVRWLGPEWFDGALFDERITWHVVDGRTFADTTDQHFDLITVTAVDTGAGLAHGGMMLAENYLYTEEAFAEYLELLNPGGLVYLYRPPKDLMRIVTTATEALTKRGAAHPERHFAAFGNEEWQGLMLFRDPATPEQIGRLTGALDEGLGGGVLQYAPGRPAAAGPFGPLFEAMGQGELDRFVAANPSISPVRDDWPFFYHSGPVIIGTAAGAFLGRVMLWVVGAGMVLILTPLLALRGRGVATGRSLLPVLVYFSGLGAGFMLIEIALIQRLVLYLGHPSYSLTVTLFTLLLSTGIGSYLSLPLVPRARQVLPLLLGAVCVSTLALAFGLPHLLSALVFPSLALRAAVAVVLLTPLGLLLGMALPLGMQLVARADPARIPWAWATNAIASVAGSVMAMVLAMVGGFSSVFLWGGLAYLAALGVALLVPPSRPS